MAKAKPKNAKKKKPAWRGMVPGGKVLPSMTLDELRNVKHAHAFLTEAFPGPPIIGYTVRSFRFCQLFATACVVENKFPPLTRCWKELDRLFTRDAAFRDGMFVPSWIMFDFPCESNGRTLLDCFEDFLDENGREHFAVFLSAIRPTRLGLYQEILRTAKVVKYRELFTERVTEVVPSIEGGSPGEIVLGRVVELDGQAYFWGDVKAFPAEKRADIEDMVAGKLFYFEGEAPTMGGLYEAFMKLAGPYWMSIVASNDRLPILDPDHYQTYLTSV
ncbi:MAG: hypothetical protein SFV15_18535 [Polyangiaceae bacterium]|nr:hypothetical protein [Polyangiaceae bacterium]